jgi:hypothetical protein
MSISTIAARVAGVALAAALLLGPGVAWAQSPHFVKATDAIDSSTGDLSASFKEAGLGGGQTVTYTLAADFSGTCRCVTKSGTCPGAANKFTNVLVSVPGTFTATKNGNITGTLTFEAACPRSLRVLCPRLNHRCKIRARLPN